MSAKEASSHRIDYCKGKSHILTFSLGSGTLFRGFFFEDPNIKKTKQILKLQVLKLMLTDHQAKELSL